MNKFKLKYTRFQIIMEIISFLFLIGMFAYVFIKWGTIPDKIPGHYNVAGEIDRWGNKGEIIVVPIISIVLYLLLTLVIRFPSIWNVPVQITNHNRDKVYGCIKSMLLMLKAEVIANFFYLTYYNIKAKPLSPFYIFVLLAVVFGTLVFFIIRMTRVAKSR